MWFAACARAVWYAGLEAEGTRTGSEPISTTRASPTFQAASSPSAAVMPTEHATRRSKSSLRPVNVITGCRANGNAP
jgi:hypothetical protein